MIFKPGINGPLDPRTSWSSSIFHKNFSVRGSLIQAMYAAGRAGGNTQSEQLGSLNNRFASYIEKVRYLEEQNKILELKIKQASKRKSEMEQNRDKDEEIKELRVQIDHATMVKVRDLRSTRPPSTALSGSLR